MLQSDQPSLTHDLTLCDREPIHIPGSIQPHGLMLVADGETLEVVGGAGDIEARLSAAWLGESLEALLGQSLVERLAAAHVEEAVILDPVIGQTEVFNVVVHRVGARLVAELDRAESGGPAPIQVLVGLDAASQRFERALGLDELCRTAADAFRQLTGFDRIMIYKFLEDDAGVVIAESDAEGVGSFLNHHFPASDIPKQARALYIRNRIRVIPDVTYMPAPLRPSTRELRELDLSDADLRSVSPIHIQYLKNMGVAASASISIVKDGVLWGLIACHHRTPREMPLPVRMSCRALASGLARQIGAKDDAGLYRERIRLRASEDAIRNRLGHDSSILDVLHRTGADLAAMLSADGFAAIQGGEIVTHGRCPPPEEVRAIAAFARAEGPQDVFGTNRLAERMGPARTVSPLASGVLAATLSNEGPAMLLWFRAEKLQVVEWAGNPHKAVSADPTAILTPRTSFQAWTETVHGRSRPWSLAETESAGRIARLIQDDRRNARLRQLNEDLASTVRDNEGLIRQKDYLLKEVNHRVQNSLQLVSAFLRLQSKAAGDEVVTAHLTEAQRRLSAVALVHKRLYSDASVEVVDLGRYLEELVNDLFASMSDEWRDLVELDLVPVLVSADRAVNVGLVLTELVINANKYAYAGRSGPLTIALEQHNNRLRLIVSDRGAGKAGGAGTGFGSRMLSAIIERLGGTLEESDNRPGLRVTVTAPVDHPQD